MRRRSLELRDVVVTRGSKTILRGVDARFEPGTADPAAHRRWRTAVERSKGWARLG